MEPAYSFEHLNIQGCWPKSGEDFFRYAAQVTPRQRDGDAELSPLAAYPAVYAVNEPHGILQVCLLSLDLFQRCGMIAPRLLAKPFHVRIVPS
jgi:hypothetical protein